MPVDDDRHIAFARRGAGVGTPDARFEMLGRQVVAAILRGHRSRGRENLAILDRALGVDRERHQAAAEQGLAGRELLNVGFGAGAEATLERQPRELVLGAGALGRGGLGAVDRAVLAGGGLQARF